MDSLKVVKQVEEYRQFWKPKKTNVVLLAESHYYTKKQDYEIKCSRLILDKLISNYPTNFVRFVYCLGYGENELLNTPIKNNRGMYAQTFHRVHGKTGRAIYQLSKYAHNIVLSYSFGNALTFSR